MFTDYEKVTQFLEKDIHNRRILVLGDIMLDRYYFGDVKRISPEAPVPVALINSEKDTLGGAANVALNLFHLGCQVDLVGVAGVDNHREKMEQMMNNLGMSTTGILTDDRPTTAKIRIVGGHQQMLRLDFEKTDAIRSKAEKAVKTYIEKRAAEGLDAILISDYAKGVCTSSVCQFVITLANKNQIPLIVDPKGYDWKKYTGAAFITPNMKELREAFKAEVANLDKDVAKAGLKIKRRFKLEHLVVTRSEKGMSLITEQSAIHIPTLAQEVFDVSGAGDTVIATMGAALAAGIAPTDAVLLANLAAGIVVGKVGTYPIHKHELIEAVQSKQQSEVIWQEVIH